VSLTDAAREPFVAFARGVYSDYRNQFAAVFADVKVKPRIVEEHNDFSSLVAAIETGTGVALVSDAFAYATGERVKLLRFNPEPKTAILGIARTHGTTETRSREVLAMCEKSCTLTTSSYNIKLVRY
jgi:DNA-binding transcriptional LysR family regulator